MINTPNVHQNFIDEKKTVPLPAISQFNTLCQAQFIARIAVDQCWSSKCSSWSLWICRQGPGLPTKLWRFRDFAWWQINVGKVQDELIHIVTTLIPKGEPWDLPVTNRIRTAGLSCRDLITRLWLKEPIGIWLVDLIINNHTSVKY